ncbi:MAG TPA: LapA family protein [Methylophilaceae bacterium]|nr:LapA family protein [Methylophilaceae bacterium]
MRTRTLILLIALGAIAIFAALNWSAFTTPTTLTLGVIDFQAPLGLVMLIAIAVLTALFLVFIITMQTTVLLETRRQSRELQTSRTLAEQAEASRYTELRLYIDGQLQKLDAHNQASIAATTACLDRIEREMRTAIDESGNSLAALIAELDDRIARSNRTG